MRYFLKYSIFFQFATTKTLLVRNIGNREARFTLSVEEPFSVSPDSGHLLIGESMQVNVEFSALQTGDHIIHMVLHYDTGMDWIIVTINIKTKPQGVL